MVIESQPILLIASAVKELAIESHPFNMNFLSKSLFTINNIYLNQLNTIETMEPEDIQKYQTKILNHCIEAIYKSRVSNKAYYLDKKSFQRISATSIDYAILEKSKNINAIKLDIPWSDLGSWKEILNIFQKNKSKYFRKTNVFYRPWGKYTNLFNGKGFLIKELIVNSKSSISLQKHRHRSEYWTIISGKPKITINKKNFFKKVDETAFIPRGAIHRVENIFRKPVKIMEAQIGQILKETDIIRYKDIYGRAN